jgi:septal ring factor EnvC (AmiA/AmiB activator)
MKDRPTPRTDAAANESIVKVYETAKDLERELAEARSEIDQLKRERDNAETDRRQAEADAIRALHERNEARAWSSKLADLADDLRADLAEAREQRDRLAATLRDIKDRALDETVRLHPDADAKGCVDDCLEWAESALAALKGGTDA